MITLIHYYTVADKCDSLRYSTPSVHKTLRLLYFVSVRTGHSGNNGNTRMLWLWIYFHLALPELLLTSVATGSNRRDGFGGINKGIVKSLR